LRIHDVSDLTSKLFRLSGGCGRIDLIGVADFGFGPGTRESRVLPVVLIELMNSGNVVVVANESSFFFQFLVASMTHDHENDEDEDEYEQRESKSDRETDNQPEVFRQRLLLVV